MLRGRASGLFGVCYTLLLLLYGWVGVSSPGYDDEIFTIRWIEQLGPEVVGLVQAVDAHPPGSFFVNWLYYEVLGDWAWVRLLIGLITASSLIYAVQCLRKRHGEFAGWTGLALLGLNPAFLLWCTGLRWYALFVPLMIWLSFPPRQDDWRYWLKCCGGLFMLAYVGYIAFILVLPVLLLYWTSSKLESGDKFKRMFYTGVPFVLLYLYQLHVFFTAALDRGGHIMGTMSRAVVGYLVAHLGNQGVFPMSVPGMISAIGMVGVMLVLLWRPGPGVIKGNLYFLPYTLGVLLTVLTGLAGHFRNLVVLSPWQGLWIATAKVSQGRRRVFMFFLACVVFGNLAGIVNVVSHSDTVKSSWNLPLDDIQRVLERERLSCAASPVLATHEPVSAYLFARKGYPVLSPYSSAEDFLEVPDAVACLVVMKTYVGSLGSKRQDLMYAQLSGLEYTSLQVQQMGRDKYFNWKQRVNPRYPEYHVEMLVYRDVRGLDTLTAWQSIWPELYRVR